MENGRREIQLALLLRVIRRCVVVYHGTLVVVMKSWRCVEWRVVCRHGVAKAKASSWVGLEWCLSCGTVQLYLSGRVK